MSRWETPAGLRVETVSYSLTSDGRDGDWLRVSRSTPACGGRMTVGEVRTPAELAGLGVDLAEMTAA